MVGCGPGGVLLGIRRRGVQKTCHFPYPFSDTWPLKSVFRPDIYVYKGLSYVTIA